MKHRNRGAGSDRDGNKELHVIGRIDAARHHAEKDAVFPGQPVGDDRVQIVGEKALDRLRLYRRR